MTRDILLGFLEADRQNVSAGDRVRLISRGVGADRHGYALNADDLLLASAFQNYFMIERSLVLRKCGERKRTKQHCGKKSIKLSRIRCVKKKNRVGSIGGPTYC